MKGNVSTGGDAIQARDRGGWVKAMAKVNADGTIARQFSALGGSISATYFPFTQAYSVTFPFPVNDRFVSVMPFINESVGPVAATVRFSNSGGFGPNDVVVFITDLDAPNGSVANEFFIFVY